MGALDVKPVSLDRTEDHHIMLKMNILFRRPDPLTEKRKRKKFKHKTTP
jgi:hypothetical protein